MRIEATTHRLRWLFTVAVMCLTITASGCNRIESFLGIDDDETEADSTAPGDENPGEGDEGEGGTPPPEDEGEGDEGNTDPVEPPPGEAPPPTDPGELTIVTGSMPLGIQGRNLNTTVRAAGGEAPYIFDVVSGELPDGVSLESTTGALSGTLQDTGDSTFTIRVRDAENESRTRQYTMNVVDSVQSVLRFPTQNRTAAASSMGMQPGLWAVAVRGDGVGSGPPQIDWANVFYGATMAAFPIQGDFEAVEMDVAGAVQKNTPGRVSLHQWDLGLEGEGWLWVETPGNVEIVLTGFGRKGSFQFGDEPAVTLEGGQTKSIQAEGVDRGFHRIRFSVVSRSYGVRFEVKLSENGGAANRITADRIWYGGQIAEVPLITKSPVRGIAFSHTLAVRGVVGTPSLRILDGALPNGLSMNSQGRITGTPSRAGTFYFTVEAETQNGLKSRRRLALHVLDVGASTTTRNDVDEFVVTFDDDAAAAAKGITWSLADNRAHLGDSGYTVSRWNSPEEGREAYIRFAEGAFGTGRSVEMNGSEVGFYLTGPRSTKFADHFPAFRKSNRFGVLIHVPEEFIRNEETFRLSEDPKRYENAIRRSLHLAGHNSLRYEGNTYEDSNWHFYHTITGYWPDHWKTSFIRYVGDGWFYLETGEQSTSQRSGFGGQAGFYTPMETHDTGYWDSMSRIYVAYDQGFHRTDRTYPDGGVFRYDNLRAWEEAREVKVTTSDNKDTYRVAVDAGVESMDIPFRIHNLSNRPMSYFIGKAGGKVPVMDGDNIWVDVNGNGAIDDGDVSLEDQFRTPLFSAGEVKNFVLRTHVNADPDTTVLRGILVRVRDPQNVMALDGDSMHMLVYKSPRPQDVLVDILVVGHRPTHTPSPYGPANRAPELTSAVPGTGQVGVAVSVSGTATDTDGPSGLRPWWDFGDGTPYVFGTSAEHVYTRPGTYKVRFYANDRITRSVIEKTIVVSE